MITLNYSFMGADLPLTIEKDALLAYFDVYKGKGLELIKELLKMYLSDGSELIKVELNEIKKLINNRYEAKN
jgi:hypothetical protein